VILFGKTLFCPKFFAEKQIFSARILTKKQGICRINAGIIGITAGCMLRFMPP
jgi:hypothetical protein